MSETKEVGRPDMSREELDDIVRKLEPYLKSGLSIRKACLEANVPHTTVYKYYGADTIFTDKINQCKQYLSVLLSNSLVAHFHDIVRKQTPRKDDKGETIPAERLSKEDVGFLQWFALNSNGLREEFGERKEVSGYDPEGELKRIMTLINSGTPDPDIPKTEAELEKEAKGDSEEEAEEEESEEEDEFDS